MKRETIRAFVFARGGSKGIPGKNIKLLAGKPLIAYPIQTALAAPSLGKVAVSTDDAEIARLAAAFGAEVPFVRPSELATDTAGEWSAWRHAIEWYAHQGDPFDVIVSLPATSPFRSVDDVENCIATLLKDPNAAIVVSVKQADRSPYFNMVEEGADGYATLVKCIDGSTVQRRQDAPLVYDMTTVAYAARTSFVLAENNMFSGKVRTIVVPPERALDIDTPFDFLIAELLAGHMVGVSLESDPRE